MNKLKENKYIILIGLLTLGFVFYWFQLRPAQIIKKSNSETFLYNSTNNQEPINIVLIGLINKKNCIKIV
ncbi:hypothetical protein A3J61_00990 [Candidatus Nomurabacteria bacterium RIFCSPHIGHO2_02_FULL_38_15]|uniref:Uncharacterized protein n=1 Tax=Candidatus Nomurabacteria bacterium RIFCSPHIGHO2_02_FULL_38_15 TaxID=1801752 RepID=A0A1F6VSI9_9BACT|nr:MAG: hypothetical protein A3J61_00990 [Candidatus Nomurabacteria bacterium RIFCSPHIGHO2_02_FULL_38_15]